MNLVPFNFGYTSVGDDVDLVVLELFLGVFADFLIVRIENMGLRLNNMY